MDRELNAWREQADRLVDVQLIAELQKLVKADRVCEARMLVLLAELDVRELYLAQGYSSLFRYATTVLRMSEAQAYLRIRAARVARAYPVVLEMLLEGALNLSTLKLLAPHLTADNHVALLERARDKNKRDVELLVAEIAPQPDVPTRFRKLPTARASTVQDELPLTAALKRSSASVTGEVTVNHAALKQSSALATDEVMGRHAALKQSSSRATREFTMIHAAPKQNPGPTLATGDVIAIHAAPKQNPGPTLATGDVIAIHAAPKQNPGPAPAAEVTASHVAVSQRAQGVASAVVPPAAAAAGAPRVASTFVLEAQRASCTALRPERYKLELTANQELNDQLMMLKHLLKHQVPSGDLSVILGLAIKELVDKLCKQRFAQLSKPSRGDRAQTSQREAAGASPIAGSPAQSGIVEPSPIARSPERACGVEPGAGIKAPPQGGTGGLASGAGSSQALGEVGPRENSVKGGSRYVPRAVVRAVFARDGAQCTFVSADGQRCAELGMLELHHVQAFALGGASTVENLKVVCRSHNAYFATRDFGAAHMLAMRAGHRTSKSKTL